MAMAPNWHASAQSPQPRHPNPQAVSPAAQAFIAAHVRNPQYSTVLGRFSHVPLHLTTATMGSVFATAIPNRSATCSITAAPPTGQLSPSRLPPSAAFTRASAIPEHPGNPQPPQLACGNTADTWAILGSSFTANFLEHTYNTAAATSAMAPSTITAINIKFIVTYFIFLFVSYSKSFSTLNFTLFPIR